MVQRSFSSVAAEERRREEQWLAAMRDATETAHGRLEQVAALLRLPPRATRCFVRAAFEVSRQYHTASMYANYERRCGHPYPYEAHAHDEEVAAHAWAHELDSLRQGLDDAHTPAGT